MSQKNPELVNYFNTLSKKDLKDAKNNFLNTPTIKNINANGRHSTSSTINYNSIVSNFKLALRTAPKYDGTTVKEWESPFSTEVAEFEKVLKTCVKHSVPANTTNKYNEIVDSITIDTFSKYASKVKHLLNQEKQSSSQKLSASSKANSILSTMPRTQPSLSAVSMPSSEATGAPALRSSIKSAPTKPEISPELQSLISNVKGPIDEETDQKLRIMYNFIYDKNTDKNKIDKRYIHYHDIWKPYLTYNAIYNMAEEDMKKSRTYQAFVEQEIINLPTIYKLIHLLHHFRVCLDILHLIYFRLDETMKDYTYAHDLEKAEYEDKHVNKPFNPLKPLIIYAGWNINCAKSSIIDKSVQPTTDTTKIKLKHLGDETNIGSGSKLLKFYMGYGEGWKKGEPETMYSILYRHIDEAFLFSDNEVDTYIEVLCLIFSVNYKLKNFKEGKIQNTIMKASDRYNPGNISNPTTLNNIPSLASYIAKMKYISEKDAKDVTYECYISDDDITRLRDLYEKHCIMIVGTLLYHNVNSFVIPMPPKQVFTRPPPSYLGQNTEREC